MGKRYRYLTAGQGVEHGDEFDKSSAVTQLAENQPHMFANRELLALDQMVCVQFGLAQDRGPGIFQVIGIDLGQALRNGFFNPDRCV